MAKETPRDRLNRQMALQRKSLEVEIPMRDGVMLAADVYLPKDTAAPVPAVVHGTPYDKGSALHELEGPLYQEHGYAFVNFDVRGRGKSEGEWRAFVHDGRDGHDVVEWVAAQPWCNGKVGTTGLSYSGWNQWATARERPPHLAAMISSAAAGRWQEEIPYTFGVFQLYFAYWIFMTRRRIDADLGQVDWNEALMRLPVDDVMAGLGAPGLTWPDMRDHDTLDAFWRDLRVDPYYQSIDVPVLHVNGWHDLEDELGGFAHYEGMMQHSPARARQKLIVGPWPHVGTRWPQSEYGGVDFGESAALEMDEIHLRFFDYWLKGVENGAAQDPPVYLFEMGTNTWRSERSWPLPSEDACLYLSYDGSSSSLGQAAPETADTPRSYRYDPMDPVTMPIDFSRLSFDEPPLDQAYAEGRPDVLGYTSPVLAEECVISGWPHLELFADSDGDDTDWHVKITDVLPDGRSIRIASGCLRAACRESLENPSPIPPGEIMRYDIELSPVTHAFLPGHRLRVTITSSDFPWFARNLNQFGKVTALKDPRVAVNTVHHGRNSPSRLHLPVVRGRLP